LQQTAPGRYLGRVAAETAGNYFLSVSAAGQKAPLRAAVNVLPTAEHRDLFSYDGFLAELAEGTPRGGQPGKLIQSPLGIADIPRLLQTDVFRPDLAPARSRTAVWPLLLLIASVAFFGDVSCRRVMVSADWIAQARSWLQSARRDAKHQARTRPIERLKASRRSAVAQFSAAFNEGQERPSTVTGPIRTKANAPSAPHDVAGNASARPEFTARLLEAKRRVNDQSRKTG
jgi:hypothetical protein